MKEINVVELLKTAKTDFTINATMICRNKTVLTKLHINTIEKIVTVRDVDSNNPKDVFVIVKESEQIFSSDRIKFFENE